MWHAAPRWVLALAVLAGALLAGQTVVAGRACGFVPLDASVASPSSSPSGDRLSEEDLGRRAREVGAARFGLAASGVVLEGGMTRSAAAGFAVYGFKVSALDGRYLGPVFLDGSGNELSEGALGLVRVIGEVRSYGKVNEELSTVVARSLPWDRVPVMLQLVAPPFDGPPTPWPLDLSPDEWNEFAERSADAFYRPRVTPFIEHLHAIGASDIRRTPSPVTASKMSGSSRKSLLVRSATPFDGPTSSVRATAHRSS